MGKVNGKVLAESMTGGSRGEVREFSEDGRACRRQDPPIQAGARRCV